MKPFDWVSSTRAGDFEPCAAAMEDKFGGKLAGEGPKQGLGRRTMGPMALKQRLRKGAAHRCPGPTAIAL